MRGQLVWQRTELPPLFSSRRQGTAVFQTTDAFRRSGFAKHPFGGLEAEDLVEVLRCRHSRTLDALSEGHRLRVAAGPCLAQPLHGRKPQRKFWNEILSCT